MQNFKEISSNFELIQRNYQVNFKQTFEKFRPNFEKNVRQKFRNYLQINLEKNINK